MSSKLLALVFFSAYIFVSANSFTYQNLIGTSSLLHGNISERCSKDSTTWMQSLTIVAGVGGDCLKQKKCTKEDEKVLKENEYAIQQLDSFGKLPVPGILELTVVYDGSYQECQRISGVKYETNYCYLILKPGKVLDNPNFMLVPFSDLIVSAALISGLVCITIYGSPCTSDTMTMPTSIKYAVCMPKSCGKVDLPIIFNQIDPLPFTVCDAYCSSWEVEKDTSFWGFTIFMIVIVAIALLATLFDYVRETSFEIPSTKEVFKILLAFSFWTNSGILLSVKEQKPGFIKSLDCIRFFSMMWVVTGHSFSNIIYSDTLMPVAKFQTEFWNHFIMNALLSVDTFFLLSGVVVAYLFFKERLKAKMVQSPMTWILFYVHRYLRLTPPIMLFIGFFAVYASYIQGPYAASTMNSLVEQAEMCKTAWWKNLLYINNFGRFELTCYGPTWYLAVDTQLYLIAPILLIGLYYSFAAGAGLIVAGCVGSFITVYVMTSVDDLPGDMFGNGDQAGFFKLFYIKPWIRCTPYLVGIMTGYLIGTYGKRRVRLNWVLSIVGWLIAFGIGALCLFSTYDYDKGSHWGVFSRATFYNFSRFGWAVAVSWVIIANHMGWGGPISNFMCHPMWQPFGRLSYCAYIVHWMVLYFFVNLGDRPMHYYSAWHIVFYYAVPVTFLAFLGAFFWSCLFEVSLLKLEKMLIEAIMGTNAKSPNKVDTEMGKKENGLVKFDKSKQSCCVEQESEPKLIAVRSSKEKL